MERILVVEDEEGVRDNIAILLEAEGYKVDSAENGFAALRHIDVNPPDLILSDIMMPGLNGMELFNKVRHDYKLTQIPFIFLTALSDAQSVRKGMSNGASDYITKPFENDDLVKSIHSRLFTKRVIEQKFEERLAAMHKFIPHELRSPLTPILGYSELIKESAKDLSVEQLEEMAEKIHWSGHRLLGRIEKFMVLHELLDDKIDHYERYGKDITTLTEEVITNTIDNHYLLSQCSDINIKINPATLKIKREYLQIIIREIIENAYKFRKSTTSITIRGEHLKSEYRFTVTNIGRGMDKDQIAAIGVFKQFEKVKQNQDGNGIGLFIVKRICEICDVNLRIKSEHNHHTDVDLVFKQSNNRNINDEAGQ